MEAFAALVHDPWGFILVVTFILVVIAGLAIEWNNPNG